MKILAIETSCDDTCVSILKIENRKFKILSNIVSSQVKLHAKYGGVYPFMAKREHQKNLPLVLMKALKKANFSISNFKFQISKQILKTKSRKLKLDLIAVTVGPGLEPCLWTGVNFAKGLAQELKIPLVSVNHIEAHIAANFLNLKSKIHAPLRTEGSASGLNLKSIFPAVCLVVSGGHTQLILMKDFGKYKILGETRDDAAGECFDKAARILGLAYPGGPAIASLAAMEIRNSKSETLNKFQIQNSKFKIHLPRPMIYQKNYDFSFSGLKTAVLYLTKQPEISKKLKAINYKLKANICAEVQQSIIDVLIHKTLRAAEEYKVKTIILGGGVAANTELRKQFKYKILNTKYKIQFSVPPKNLCTDNAAMVAAAGYYRWLMEETKLWQDINANANLRLI